MQQSKHADIRSMASEEKDETCVGPYDEERRICRMLVSRKQGKTIFGYCPCVDGRCGGSGGLCFCISASTGPNSEVPLVALPVTAVTPLTLGPLSL